MTMENAITATAGLVTSSALSPKDSIRTWLISQNSNKSGTVAKVRKPLSPEALRVKNDYGSPAGFASAFSKDWQMELLRNPVSKGVLACNSNIPTLDNVAEAFDSVGAATVIKWLEIQVKDLCAYVERERVATEGILHECCARLFARYGYLNVLEVHLFLSECKGGVYGSFYGYFTPDKFMSMLNAYVRARDVSIEEVRIEDNRRRRAEEKNLVASYEEYLEIKKRAEEGDEEAKKLLLPPEQR